jgi:hypothetical protein
VGLKEDELLGLHSASSNLGHTSILEGWQAMQKNKQTKKQTHTQVEITKEEKTSNGN